MKLKHFLLFCILINSMIKNQQKVINSCGNDFKNNNEMPNKTDDCKDDEEPFCKFVKITKNGDSIQFCAIIHGNYDDEDVIKEVKDLINGTIEVSESKYLIGKSAIIYNILFYILLFLF